MHFTYMPPKLPWRSYGNNNQLLNYTIMKKFTKLSKAEMKNVLGGDYAACYRACMNQAQMYCFDSDSPLTCLNQRSAGCAVNCSVAQP